MRTQVGRPTPDELYSQVARWRPVIAALAVAALVLVFVGPLLLSAVASLVGATVLAGVAASLVVTRMSLRYQRDGVTLRMEEVEERVLSVVTAAAPRARLVRSGRAGCAIRPDWDTRHRLSFRWLEARDGTLSIRGKSEPPSLGEFSPRLLRARATEWASVTARLDEAFDSRQT